MCVLVPCCAFFSWHVIFFSNTFAEFVKSQEGENEEGNEGELVVKFAEALPKVVQLCFSPYLTKLFQL